jgi:hypothetical protein
MPATLAYNSLAPAGQIGSYGNAAPAQAGGFLPGLANAGAQLGPQLAGNAGIFGQAVGNTPAMPATTTPAGNQAPLVMSRFGQWVPANHPDAMNNPLAALQTPLPAPVAAPGMPPTAARNPWASTLPGAGTLGGLYSQLQGAGLFPSNALQRSQIMPQRFAAPTQTNPNPALIGAIPGQFSVQQPQLGVGQLGSLVRRQV